MNLLITGGAGYVGYALIQHLLAEPGPLKEILIYDNLSRKNFALFSGSPAKDIRIRFVQGELLDGRSLSKTLENADAVVHLAAKVSTPFADNEAHFFDQINHWGTAQLVQAATDSPSLKKFLYLSSVSVYGHQPEPVNEQTPPHPDSFYGHAKYRGEEQLVRLPAACDSYILRAGNVYGYSPAMRLDAVLNRFVFEAHFQGRITLHGNGDQNRPFVHVDKLAAVIRTILLEAVPRGVYNVVEHNFSVRELARAVAKHYPDLEMHTINQHIQMKSLRVQVPGLLQAFAPFPPKSLDEELAEFSAHFAF